MSPRSGAGALLAILLLGGAAIPAHAQRSGIEVERRGAARIDVDPGKTVTAVFRVSNTRAAATRVDARIHLPAGWRAVTGGEPFALAAGGAGIRIISIAVPNDARPGAYSVFYSARYGSGTEVQSRDSVLVVVRERWELELKLLEAPRFVVAGEAYAARFHLVHRGNAAGRVRLRLRSIPDLPARTDSTALLLAPGEVRTIAVEVATTAGLTRKLSHHLELQAGPEATDSLVVRASSQVDVLPGGDDASPPALRLPVELRLRATEPAGMGAPVEVRGGGKLSEGGAARVDFLLRGPTVQHSLFGEREEYRLRLRSTHLDLLLGDQVYALSPLTEPGTFGSGAGGRVTLGGLSLGAFTHRNRRLSSGGGAHAAQIGYRFGRAVEVGAHYLERTGRDSGEVATLRSIVQPLRNTTVDLEYGRGIGDADASQARSVHLRGSLPRLGYEVQHIRADPGYPGRNRGLSHDFARLALYPWRRLRLDGSVRRFEQKTGDWSTGLMADQQTRMYNAGLAYGNAIAAEYRREERAGRLLASALDRDLQSIRLRLGLHAGGVSLQPTTEFGTVLDHSTGEELPYRWHTLRSGLSFGGGQSISATIEHFEGPTIYSVQPQERLSASLGASVQFTPATRIRLSMSGNRYGGANARLHALVDAGLEQSLPFGHRLSAKTRITAFGTASALARDAVFTADYIIPLGVPVPATDARAKARVRIYDAETGAGLANVPVHLDERTMLSDRDGNVTFAGLKAGTHFLRLDRQSLELDRVAMQRLPLAVTVTGGKATRVDIAIARSVRLSGAVQLFAFERVSPPDTTTTPVAAGELKDMLVELSREGEVLRRLSDARGRFDFSDLRPGRWTLRVVAGELPPHHYFEKDTFHLELRPGTSEEVLLRALPRRRPVRIIASGEIAVVAADADAAPADRPRGARPAAPAREYRVASDDISLMNIARRVYDDASLWPRLWLANSGTLPDPDYIRPGQVLRVPPKRPLTPEERRARDTYYATSSPPARLRTYRVTSDDFGLRSVARNVYGDPSLWPKIWVANRREVPDPDYIRSGQLLRIPPKAPLTPEELEAMISYMLSRPQ